MITPKLRAPARNTYERSVKTVYVFINAMIYGTSRSNKSNKGEEIRKTTGAKKHMPDGRHRMKLATTTKRHIDS